VRWVGSLVLRQLLDALVRNPQKLAGVANAEADPLDEFAHRKGGRGLGALGLSF